MAACPRCGSEKIVKAGSVKGKRRQRCKHCNYLFTRSTRPGRPLEQKLLALQLYLRGMSMRSIGQLLNVSTPAVLKWIRAFGENAQSRPEPGKTMVVELDELCHVLGQKNEKYGSGLLFVGLTEGLSTGKWVIVEAGH